MDRLDPNITRKIALLLDIESIYTMRATCALLREDLSHNYFWYQFLVEYHDNNLPDYSLKINYHTLYETEYRDRRIWINYLKIGFRNHEGEIKSIISYLDNKFLVQSFNRNGLKCKVCSEVLRIKSGRVCSYACLVLNFRRKKLYTNLRDPLTYGMFQYWINQSLN